MKKYYKFKNKWHSRYIYILYVIFLFIFPSLFLSDSDYKIFGFKIYPITILFFIVGLVFFQFFTEIDDDSIDNKEVNIKIIC